MALSSFVERCQAPSVVGAVRHNGATAMSRIVLFSIPLALVLGSTSLAIGQTTPQATDQAAPVAGANSFTENQAKDRIEKALTESLSVGEP